MTCIILMRQLLNFAPVVHKAVTVPKDVVASEQNLNAIASELLEKERKEFVREFLEFGGPSTKWTFQIVDIEEPYTFKHLMKGDKK